MKIRVHTEFRFTHDNGESENFTVGVHDVSSAIAQHWFVQAHAETIDAADEPVPADYDAELVALRSVIDDLTNQLTERDKQVAVLTQQLEERDTRIAELMLGDSQSAPNGGKNGGNKK
ncbi:protein of unknown function [Xenorhabdus poinarii G6]|uniref:Bacteriophage protein n=1 Tax=Xenorhabdus poinarii G6 TaxID=1354304 RepID=A0A068R3I9_9GAMM|nr:hypothetical protein [Xenorhabdus poinarii]CDG20685.1 protein of unknown function [Xenorhabdus poinarii G6]